MTKPENPLRAVLGVRDFRLLWVGSATSLLGDQFAFVAMSWLVLQLTGDPLALGLVLAMAGIPRALIILVGGAVTDRYSQRTILIFSDIGRTLLTGLLAILIFTGSISLWMLYAYSLAFGFVSGFAMPASQSIVPLLVKDSELEAGNSVTFGTAQLVSFIGPAVAGAAIGWFAYITSSTNAINLYGIGVAFAIDALTFAVSTVTLWMMRVQRSTAHGAETGENVLAAIKLGIQTMWREPFLRLFFIVSSLINLLLIGPISVGIPLLANTRLPEGVAGYGIIVSGYAGGNLLGLILVAALPRLRGSLLSNLVVVLLAGFGIGFAAMAWIDSMWVAFGVMFVLGVANGYLEIILIAQVQRRTPRAMLGRIMSLLLFASIGLGPLSQVVSGALGRWSLAGMFLFTGVMILLLAAWTARQPGLGLIAEEPVDLGAAA